MSNLILIGGGARSGKSRFAVKLAETFGPRRVFLATAQARDPEMQERIRRHQAERENRFLTVECPTELPEAVMAQRHADVILIDCLTLFLANLLEQDLGNERILLRVDALVAAAARATVPVIIVSNEVGMGLVSMNDLGRRFQDLAGFSHQRIAVAATTIYLAALGCMLQLKPGPVCLVNPECTPT